MNIAIKGSNGFIGANLTQRLLHEATFDQIIFLKRNQSIAQLKKVLKNADLVYDLSGITHNTQLTIKNLEDQIISNTINPFSIAILLKPNQKLIWVSTKSAENLDATNLTKNIYPFSKYLAEKILSQFKNVKIIRISDVYGSGQDITKKTIHATYARRIQRFIAAYLLLSKREDDWIPTNDKLHGKKVFYTTFSANNTSKIEKFGIINGLLRHIKMQKDIIEYAGSQEYLKQMIFFGRERLFQPVPQSFF